MEMESFKKCRVDADLLNNSETAQLGRAEVHDLVYTLKEKSK